MARQLFSGKLTSRGRKLFGTIAVGAVLAAGAGGIQAHKAFVSHGLAGKRLEVSPITRTLDVSTPINSMLFQKKFGGHLQAVKEHYGLTGEQDAALTRLAMDSKIPKNDLLITLKENGKAELSLKASDFAKETGDASPSQAAGHRDASFAHLYAQMMSHPDSKQLVSAWNAIREKASRNLEGPGVGPIYELDNAVKGNTASFNQWRDQRQARKRFLEYEFSKKTLKLIPNGAVILVDKR
ncbi:MAG: hypothetical protein WC792_00685 [Candidatus Micrarchaeia archaeon]|jgi:hypothetical protein